ncbi:MAG: hypothetical protein JRJ31_12960 [Deltaproteobacteria bacterium]|nr:hypothetical protein [Deltaproteobacteria bacterium]
MAGYEIFEQRYLTHFREDGIRPNEIEIGFLDFLRELTTLAEGIPRYSSFMVTGIDDVLYMARKDDRRSIIMDIRRTLQSSAKDLERKMIQVQIVCKGKLFKADSFWLEYRDEKLRIDFIFGTPLKQQIRDCPVFTTGFNLSS